MADDGKDIDVARFGFDYSEVHVSYEESIIGKSGKTRGYLYPGSLSEGIYIVSGAKEQAVFDFADDEMIELSVGRNTFLVSCRDKDNTIVNAKQLLDCLVADIVYSDTNKELSTYKSYYILSNSQYLEKIEDAMFD